MKNLKKSEKIIYFILFVIMIVLFIVIGKHDFSDPEMNDHKKFAEEYNLVPEKNVFKYANNSETYAALKNGNVIVLFGFPKNAFTAAYANLVNEVALECKIDEILYYDFYQDRKNNNGTYESIVNYLGNYLYKTDNNKVDLTAPSMVVVKDGSIMYYDNETSYTYRDITSDDYWTLYNKDLKKATFKSVFTKYKENKNGK